MDTESTDLAASRHLKRAQRLLREAIKEVAQSRDLDPVAQVVVRRKEDIDSVADLLELSLTEHQELDVIIVATVNPQRSSAKENRNGQDVLESDRAQEGAALARVGTE